MRNLGMNQTTIETKFNQKHHELELFAQAVYEPTKQPISLRKKYIINSPLCLSTIYGLAIING